MIERKWGHIINMSPPLDLAMVPGRIAYSISKLGMTLLSFGLAEEARPHNIAVNSLWPVTIIESQASINHALGKPEMWRKPDILVDCVLRLAQKEPAEITGQALLDEDFFAHRRNDGLQRLCLRTGNAAAAIVMAPVTAELSHDLPRIKSITQQPRTCSPGCRQWFNRSSLLHPASSRASAMIPSRSKARLFVYRLSYTQYRALIPG